MFDDDFDDDLVAQFRAMKAQMSPSATLVAQVLDDVAADDDAFDEQFRQLKAQMKPDQSLVAKVLQKVGAQAPGPDSHPDDQAGRGVGTDPPPDAAQLGAPGTQPWGPPTGEPARWGPPVWVPPAVPQPAVPAPPEQVGPPAAPPPPPTQVAPLVAPAPARQPPQRRGSSGPARLVIGSLTGAVAAVALAVVLMMTGLFPLGAGPDPTAGPANPPIAGWPAPNGVPSDYAAIYSTLTTTTWREPTSTPPNLTEPQATAALFSERESDRIVSGVDQTNTTLVDGQFLYVVRGLAVSVMKADGAGSQTLATKDMRDLVDPGESLTGPALNLLISGRTLVVLVQGFTDHKGWSVTIPNLAGVEATWAKAAFYDISDPANPVYLGKVKQSGAYEAARIIDGTLYLVSSLTVAPAGVNPADPSTFLPVFDDGHGAAPVAPANVEAQPSVDQPIYTAVGAVEMARRTFVDEQVVLGWSGGSIHMGQSGLYLATPVSKPGDSKILVPGFADYDKKCTDLVRIAFDHGSLSVAGQATLPGGLISVHSIDESGGHVRLATNWNDKANGRPSVPGLWVLDESLAPVGSVRELSAGEVSDVRFDGPVAYVTYDDSMFPVDVSDPANPVVRGDLTMPAFPGSTYLHPYSDTLRLGVVRTRDGWGFGSDHGLELWMFNVANPYGVTKLATEATDQDDWLTMADPKSVLVDPQRGLVGFSTWILDPADPTVNTSVWDYHVYKWTGSGFEFAASLPVMSGKLTGGQGDASGSLSIRSVVVGDYLYVVTWYSVQVYDLGGFSQQREVVW